MTSKLGKSKWWVVALVIAAVAAGIAFAVRSRKPTVVAMDGMAGMAGKGAASSAHAAGTVKLSPAQMRDLGITFGTAERRELADEVSTIGTVAIDEARVAQVASRFAGFAEHLHVDFVGASVVRGEPMIEIYSPAVVVVEQEMLSARALGAATQTPTVPGVPASSTDLGAAARARLRSWEVSDAEIEDVLRAGTPRRTVTLYAPMSGVVTEKSVVLGQAVAESQPLYSIADLSVVWVMAAVREADAARVKVGAAASVELTSQPGRSWTGHVTYVYPTLDSQTRAVRARIAVANTRGMLKPGMYATVRLSSSAREALTVPSSAVVRTGERDIVFVEMESGRLEPRDVTVGRTAGDLTEVLAGVEPGQRVVTSAQFIVSSESNLAEVMRGMMAQQGMEEKP
ncbi:MAG: efflux RND transporter periplasmic adaptor subunit [Gemmatimonadales bacterium]|jgi:multidrug efflux pump subunit AcrA (membrane-fusion protein)